MTSKNISINSDLPVGLDRSIDACLTNIHTVGTMLAEALKMSYRQSDADLSSIGDNISTTASFLSASTQEQVCSESILVMKKSTNFSQ